MMDELLTYLRNPIWRRQLRWRKAIWVGMSSLGLTGVHALPLNRRWVDIHRRRMPLHDLDPNLAGMKIVQISDLHYSPVVWQRYLVQYVRWVNELERRRGRYHRRPHHRRIPLCPSRRHHPLASARAPRGDLHVRQPRLQHLRKERIPRGQTPGRLPGEMPGRSRDDCPAKSNALDQQRRRQAAGDRRSR